MKTKKNIIEVLLREKTIRRNNENKVEGFSSASPHCYSGQHG